MTKGFKIFVQVVLMLFPWTIRRRLLCACFGYKIERSAQVGVAVILAKHLVMGSKARINNLVICKPIDWLIMEEDTAIGTATYITGIPENHAVYYRHMPGRKCELILERGACITGRHYVDCSCGIRVGSFTTIAGLRSQIMTHSLDVYHCRQGGAPIKIGKYCFIGTQCILLPGASIPDYSIIGAGSVVNRDLQMTGTLYAGVPATAKKKVNIEELAWMSRTTSNAETGVGA